MEEFLELYGLVETLITVECNKYSDLRYGFDNIEFRWGSRSRTLDIFYKDLQLIRIQYAIVNQGPLEEVGSVWVGPYLEGEEERVFSLGCVIMEKTKDHFDFIHLSFKQQILNKFEEAERVIKL